MLLIMGGATLSAAGSFRGSVTVPQGLNFVVGDVLNPSGFLSKPTEAFNTEVHVNNFYMDYYDSGEVCLNEETNNNYKTSGRVNTVLGITTLHDGMILSTLSLSSYACFGFPQKASYQWRCIPCL